MTGSLCPRSTHCTFGEVLKPGEGSGRRAYRASSRMESTVSSTKLQSIRELALVTPLRELSTCHEFVEGVAKAMGLAKETRRLPFTRKVFRATVRLTPSKEFRMKGLEFFVCNILYVASCQCMIYFRDDRKRTAWMYIKWVVCVYIYETTQ